MESIKGSLIIKRFLIWIVSSGFTTKRSGCIKQFQTFFVFFSFSFSACNNSPSFTVSPLPILFLISSLSTFDAFITCSIYYFLHSLNANWLRFFYFRGKVLCLLYHLLVFSLYILSIFKERKSFKQNGKSFEVREKKVSLRFIIIDIVGTSFWENFEMFYSFLKLETIYDKFTAAMKKFPKLSIKNEWRLFFSKLLSNKSSVILLFPRKNIYSRRLRYFIPTLSLLCNNFFLKK